MTEVGLTKDLRIARVFVTTMEQNKDERLVFDGLAKASGCSQAGKMVRGKIAPLNR